MSLLVFCSDYVHPKADRSLLTRSCERVGITLQTYGHDRNWPGSYGVAKILHALEFLKTRTEDVCLYTDSQDSLLVHDAHAILNAWMRCGAPHVLLQAEKNCYPEPSWEPEYPRTDSPWRYICAGGWMGTREGLIAALTELAEGEQFAKDSFCDQRCWTDWYLRHPSGKLKAALDTNCEVFQSMAGTGEIREDGLNTATGTRPSVWHFNGRVGGESMWYRGITGDA